MAQQITWSKSTTSEELHSVLETLGEEYPIVEDGEGIPVFFVGGAEPGLCRVERAERKTVVHYASTAMAVRAAGGLIAGLIAEGDSCEERSPFTQFGIMLDCSRNAVMCVDYLKSWLRRLALLGYNSVLLYTEDTYKLPDEPYFGYLRGAYTADEIKEIDAYAARLGIEVIPCIQTLGHLEQILRWPAYSAVKDTDSVLLVDQEETYALIGKMLDFWSDACTTRRVHIGMDETHDLGRGRFMDLHGYENGFTIFNRHLAKVVEQCRERDLEPMIWSDMYFRLGSKTGNYYDRECVIPQEVIDQIPKEAQLVYWDYYHADEEFYLDWIERHRALGSEPIMGSGVWTWSKLWHDRKLTEENAGACIDACRKSGVSEIFFTMWGDDGAYCDFDSAFAGLAYATEKAFAGEVDEERLAARFSAVCTADYTAVSIASSIEQILAPNAVLWDDPLLNIYQQNCRAREPEALARAEQQYLDLATRLEPHAADAGAGRLSHLRMLSLVLGLKTGLTERLIVAYEHQDQNALKNVIDEIPTIEAALRQISDAFREIWLSRNKPFGLEVIQIRMGGQLERYRELSRRLEDFLDGKVDTIPELDENQPQAPDGNLGRTTYNWLATSSRIL